MQSLRMISILFLTLQAIGRAEQGIPPAAFSKPGPIPISIPHALARSHDAVGTGVLDSMDDRDTIQDTLARVHSVPDDFLWFIGIPGQRASVWLSPFGVQVGNIIPGLDIVAIQIGL